MSTFFVTLHLLPSNLLFLKFYPISFNGFTREIVLVDMNALRVLHILVVYSIEMVCRHKIEIDWYLVFASV
jgi:hypothetical protein